MKTEQVNTACSEMLDLGIHQNHHAKPATETQFSIVLVVLSRTTGELALTF